MSNHEPLGCGASGRSMCFTLVGMQPDLDALEKYQRHAGAPGGVWPSSPEISSAMLERYKKQNGNGGEPNP